jgi:hypothetical protein
MAQYMIEASKDVLKALRFEIGCVDHNRLREMLRLERFVCNKICYIDEDQDRSLREAVIKNAITKIYEI